jgi:uncharacterized protein
MLRDDSTDPGRRRAAVRNVLGEPLDIFSIKPTTGFYRDGYCNTRQKDVGSHSVCRDAPNGPVETVGKLAVTY